MRYQHKLGTHPYPTSLSVSNVSVFLSFPLSLSFSLCRICHLEMQIPKQAHAPHARPNLESCNLATDLRPAVLDVVVAAAVYLLSDLGEALVLLPSQLQQLLVLLRRYNTPGNRSGLHSGKMTDRNSEN